MGMRVFNDGAALLDDLGSLAYRVSGPDVARCMQWFRETSNAVPHLARDIRLPAPGRFKRKAPLGPAFSIFSHGRGRGPFRCFRPYRSVFAGSRFISADGLVDGSYAAVTPQQAALMVIPAVFLADVACFIASVSQDSDILFDGFDRSEYIFFAVIICFACVAVPLMLILPLRVFGDLDARARHSELLLPLHVAAFMGEAAAVTQEQMRVLSRSRHRRSLPTFLPLLRDLSTTATVMPTPIAAATTPTPVPAAPLPSASPASFKLCVLMSLCGEDSRPPHAVAPVDPHLPERLRNICSFLRDVGLESVVVPPRAFGGTCDDSHPEVRMNPPSVLVVCVYVLRSRAAALAWCAAQHAAASAAPGSDAAARAIPYTRQLLIVDGAANDNICYVPPSPEAGAPAPPPVWFRDTVYSASGVGLAVDAGVVTPFPLFLCS